MTKRREIEMRVMRSWVAGLVVLGLAFAALADEKKDEKVKTEKVLIGPAYYQVPATWERQQPRNRMRTLQLGIPLAKGDEGKCEFVVFYFGGGGGSVEANLKRWIGMFAEKEGKEKIEKFEAGGMKITTLDLAGIYKDKPAPFVPKVTLRKNWRMLAAIIVTPEDGPYFFRIVGPKKTVSAQLESWNNLLREVELK